MVSGSLRKFPVTNAHVHYVALDYGKFRLHQIMKDPHQIMKDPHHIVNDLHNIMKDLHHIRKDPHNIMKDPHQMKDKG